MEDIMEKENKKIFITGCAKSGTTLLLRMCYAFKNSQIIYEKGFDGHELSFEEFINYKGQEKYLIGKRHPPCILSNIEEDGAFREQRDIILQNEIYVINVVRDGRDVVLSDGNYVKPRRWIDSMRQREDYKEIISYEIKYENLIEEPDKIQNDLMKITGLEKKYNFSEYPKYVEDWVYDWDISVLGRAGQDNKSYSKRPLSKKSILKDPMAYKKICTKEELKMFDFYLKKTGYI